MNETSLRAGTKAFAFGLTKAIYSIYWIKTS